MKNSMKILLAACLCLTLASALALAQGPGDNDGPGPDQAMWGPDDETREAIHDAVQEHMLDIYPTMQLLKAREAELNILIYAQDMDQAAVDAKIAEITDIQAQLFVKKIQLKRAIFEITGMPCPDMGFGPGHGGRDGRPGQHRPM